MRFGHDWDATCMQMDEVMILEAELLSSQCITAREELQSSQFRDKDACVCVTDHVKCPDSARLRHPDAIVKCLLPIHGCTFSRRTCHQDQARQVIQMGLCLTNSEQPCRVMSLPVLQCRGVSCKERSRDCHADFGQRFRSDQELCSDLSCGHQGSP